MILKYPLKEREKLLDFGLQEEETGFYLGVRIDDDTIEYSTLQFVFGGKKYNIPTEEITDTLNKNKDKLKNSGLHYIHGHVHPVPEGRIIRPAFVGWTIARTKELRDYRNARIMEMDDGKKYLKWRKAQLKKYSKMDPTSPEAGELDAELFERSSEFGEANLIERNGLTFYITNKVRHKDAEKDIMLYSGDTAGFLGRRDYINFCDIPHLDIELLVKPKREFVWTPSSRDKFEIVGMRYNSEVFGDWENVEIVD